MTISSEEIPFGDVAQLGEHLLCKQGVASSNLVISIVRERRPVGISGCPAPRRDTYLKNRIAKKVI
jgi:hypothetical protein